MKFVISDIGRPAHKTLYNANSPIIFKTQRTWHTYDAAILLLTIFFEPSVAGAIYLYIHTLYRRVT